VNRKVFFIDGNGGPLLCDGVRYAKRSYSGRVINGEWDLKIDIRNQKWRAYAGRKLMNQGFYTELVIVDVPKHVKGDYNKVIAWAEEQLANPQAPVPSSGKPDEPTP
jgi:hypothetical protein